MGGKLQSCRKLSNLLGGLREGRALYLLLGNEDIAPKHHLIINGADNIEGFHFSTLHVEKLLN